MKKIRLLATAYWFLFGHVFMSWAETTAPQTFKGIIPADEGEGSIGKKIASGEVSLNDVPIVIIYLIDLLTKLAGTVAVVFILYAGFQLITSGLDESAREEAKNTLQYAAIGLVVCLLAWVIVNLIQVQLTA